MSLRRTVFGLSLLVVASSGCKKTERTISLTSMAYGNGTYVAIGQLDHNGNVRPFGLRSSDGVTWGEVPIPSSGTLTRVYANGKGFVAVGSRAGVTDESGGAAGGDAGGAAGVAGTAGVGGAVAGSAGTGGAAGEVGAGAAGAAGDTAAGAAGAAGEGTAGAAGGGAAGGGAAGTAGASGQSGTSGQGGAGMAAAGASGASAQNKATPGSGFATVDPAGPGLTTQAGGRSQQGLVLLSDDGKTWRLASNSPLQPLLDVTEGSTGLVAASSTGLFWSSNGEVWIRQPVGSVLEEKWADVEYGNGRFVALGPKPAVSTDGKSWRTITKIPDNELRGLRFTGGFFYSQGKVNGFFGGTGNDRCTLLRSSDGENWAPEPGAAAPGCIYDLSARRAQQETGFEGGNGDTGQLAVLTGRGLYERASKDAAWGIRSRFSDQDAVRVEFGDRWVTATTEAIWASEDAVTWRQVFSAP